VSHEPIKPLFEDASAPSELRNFVALARNDGASQAELDRMAKRMAPVLGVSAAFIASSAAAIGSSAPLSTGAGLGASGLATSAFGAPASGLTSAIGAASAAKVGAASAAKAGLFTQLMASATAKVLAVSLSVGAAGAVVYGATRSERPPSTPQVPAQQAGESVRAAGLAGRGAGAALPKQAPATVVEAAPVAETLAAQSSAGEGAAQASALRVAPGAHKRAALSQRPAAAAKPIAPPAAEPSVTDQPAELPAAPVSAPAQVSPPPPSELSLIERAEALRARPSEALAFLAKHEEVYPHGALAQEREVLAIELLLRAGKLSQADARAEHFEDAYPRSAHLPHVRALLTRAGAK
jgi:hypothetical protein